MPQGHSCTSLSTMPTHCGSPHPALDPMSAPRAISPQQVMPHPAPHSPAQPWTVPRGVPSAWGCLGAPPAALSLAGAVVWSLAAWPALTDPWGVPTAPWHLSLRNVSAGQKSKDKLSLASTKTSQTSPSTQDIFKF